MKSLGNDCSLFTRCSHVVRCWKIGLPVILAMIGAAACWAQPAPTLADLEKAAGKGDPIAQTKLGEMYLSGEGVPQDDAKSIEWTRKAADQGYAEAQVDLGYDYENGYGVVQNDEVAAKQGYADAQLELGFRSQVGKGVEANSAQAMQWYGLAAQQGDALAQHALGDMYQQGLGVPEDDEEAIRWYRKAAAQGDVSAQSALGFIYEFSKTVPIDLKEAAKWYRLAADQGYVLAEFQLAILYEYGRGVSKDLVEAYKLFSKAAASNDDETTYKEDAIQEVVNLIGLSAAVPLAHVVDAARRGPRTFSHRFKSLIKRSMPRLQRDNGEKPAIINSVNQSQQEGHSARRRDPPAAGQPLHEPVPEILAEPSEGRRRGSEMKSVGKPDARSIIDSVNQTRGPVDMWRTDKRQKAILILIATVLVILVLYPPFHFVVRGSQFNRGFSFILSPPTVLLLTLACFFWK